MLQTKLAYPPLRPFPVPRPHLFALLNDATKRESGAGGNLLLVSAPAGFGKTTLIAQWLQQLTETRTAWLSLDAEDNDPARFLAYFAAALQKLCPDCRLPPLPPAYPSSQAVMAPLLNELQQMDRPAVLVLDDLHDITVAPIYTVLAHMLEHAPPLLHLVLITRQDPPLPLARLRLQGRLTEVRAAALRFSEAETAVFLQKVMQLDVPAPTVARLSRKTEGWAAGIQLAALAMRRQEAPLSSLPAAFDAGVDLVGSYLLQEVFQHCSAAVQTFLLYTSTPAQLCIDLCAALLPAAPVAELVREVVQANLFLSPLDGRSRWFRYHPIFRQFLQEHLRQQEPDLLPQLHRRAAAWMAANGFADTAVHHYLAAGAVRDAARQMAAVISARIQQGELDTVSRWLDRLPPPLVWAEPELALARLWHFAATGRAEAIMAQAEQLADFPQPNRAEPLALLALGAAMGDRPEQARELAQQAEKEAAANQPQTEATVAFALAAAYKTGGAFAQAEAAFLRADLLAAQAGLTNIQFSAVANLGDMQFEQGNLFAAAHTSRRALNLPWPNAPAAHPFTGWIHWSLGRIQYEWNDLARAQEHANQSVPLCEAWGHTAMAVRGQLLRTAVKRASGEPAAAQSMLDYAEQLAQQSGDGRMVAAVTYHRLLLALQQGDLYAARHWVNRLRAHEEAPGYVMNLAAARLALVEQHFETALTHLDGARRLLHSRQYVPLLLKTLLLTALTHHGQGATDAAQQAWQQALSLGEQGGFIRTFIDEGEAVLTLLHGQTAVSPYQARLGAAFTLADPRPAVHLTPREQEILQLLAAGLSNREIAAQLVIAESTAKRHVSNLYRKLDVHSRTQALHRAADLALL